MNKEEAIAYLKRKNKEPTDKEISKVMQEGKIYGDPLVEVGF